LNDRKNKVGLFIFKRFGENSAKIGPVDLEIIGLQLNKKSQSDLGRAARSPPITAENNSMTTGCIHNVNGDRLKTATIITGRYYHHHTDILGNVMLGNYTSAHDSGRKYYILLLKFLSFFPFATGSPRRLY